MESTLVATAVESTLVATAVESTLSLVATGVRTRRLVRHSTENDERCRVE